VKIRAKIKLTLNSRVSGSSLLTGSISRSPIDWQLESVADETLRGSESCWRDEWCPEDYADRTVGGPEARSPNDGRAAGGSVVRAPTVRQECWRPDPVLAGSSCWRDRMLRRDCSTERSAVSGSCWRNGCQPNGLLVERWLDERAGVPFIRRSICLTVEAVQALTELPEATVGVGWRSSRWSGPCAGAFRFSSAVMAQVIGRLQVLLREAYWRQEVTVGCCGKVCWRRGTTVGCRYEVCWK
jgi:hypothetical protein